MIGGMILALLMLLSSIPQGSTPNPGSEAESATATEKEWIVEPIEMPSGPSARWPSLAWNGPAASTPVSTDGEGDVTWMVWTEEGKELPGGEGKRHRLLLSRYSATTREWSEPLSASEGEDWFVNWADVPRVGFQGERLVTTWLGRLGSGTYAYGVRYGFSEDRGESFSEPRLLHAAD